MKKSRGENNEPISEQDGIAPQVAIPGINPNQRVPIDDSAPKGQIDSHLIGNYGWVFGKKKGENNGYVLSRKK